MIDFSSWLNLPFVWGVIICIAVLMYVILDGFDLGVGILFPFAPTDRCRDRMMNTIAPFWDGNETWLILGGGGLFAAFPLAYAIIMPACYVPVSLMLMGLIFRGVAFEFRFKASEKDRPLWDLAFHVGSTLAAFSQGLILGAIVQGVTVEGRSFAGGSFDWLTPFSLMTGVAVIFGYALLGSTWLVMKTDDETQPWARRCTRYLTVAVALFMGLVSLTMPFVNDGVKAFWFSMPNLLLLSPIPLASLALIIQTYKDAGNELREYRPFFMTIGIFILGFVGLGMSIWPWVVPYSVSFREAASASTSLSLMLVGVVILLPVILGYTAYSYYVFRGKSSHESLY